MASTPRREAAFRTASVIGLGVLAVGVGLWLGPLLAPRLGLAPPPGGTPPGAGMAPAATAPRASLTAAMPPAAMAPPADTAPAPVAMVPPATTPPATRLPVAAPPAPAVIMPGAGLPPDPAATITPPGEAALPADPAAVAAAVAAPGSPAGRPAPAPPPAPTDIASPGTPSPALPGDAAAPPAALPLPVEGGLRRTLDPDGRASRPGHALATPLEGAAACAALLVDVGAGVREAFAVLSDPASAGATPPALAPSLFGCPDGTDTLARPAALPLPAGADAPAAGPSPTPGWPGPTEPITLRPPFVPITSVSLEVEGLRVHLDGIIGVGTHEICTEAGGPRWNCGLRGRAALNLATRGRDLTCQPVRWLNANEVVARCINRDGDIARAMVAAGYARLPTPAEAPPDLSPPPDLAPVETTARTEARGVWSGRWPIGR